MMGADIIEKSKADNTYSKIKCAIGRHSYNLVRLTTIPITAIFVFLACYFIFPDIIISTFNLSMAFIVSVPAKLTSLFTIELLQWLVAQIALGIIIILCLVVPFAVFTIPKKAYELKVEYCPKEQYLNKDLVLFVAKSTIVPASGIFFIELLYMANKIKTDAALFDANTSLLIAMLNFSIGARLLSDMVAFKDAFKYTGKKHDGYEAAYFIALFSCMTIMLLLATTI